MELIWWEGQLDQLALLVEFLEGHGCSLVATRGDFQGFLEDFQQLVEGFQQLLEEFRQLSQGLGVDCLEEGFVEQNPSESIAEQDGDG